MQNPEIKKQKIKNTFLPTDIICILKICFNILILNAIPKPVVNGLL
jgi:hypothetical protein